MRLFLLLVLALTTACSPARRGGSGDGDSDDSHEPNDSAEAAADVDCGDSLQGTAADADWFTWDTGDAGPVVVQITWTDGDADLTVSLEGPDGAVSCDEDGLSVSCSAQAAAGTWLLGVIPLDDAAASYGIGIECTAAPGDDDDDDDDATDDDDAADDDDATPADAVNNEQGLVGRAFSVDFESATFVEPPGVGAILQSQLGDTEMLCDILPSSDLSAGEIHYVFAMGDGFGGQDYCQVTTQPTWGNDGVVGTSDDQPGVWDNPYFEMGPVEGMSLTVDGLPMMLNSFEMTGVFTPSGNAIVDGTLDAVIDTRPLAPLLDEEGGPSAICDLVSETIGVSCVECGAPNPGQFCLNLSIEDSEAQPTGDTLAIRTCSDILGDFACEDEWQSWDEDGDGFPELCE